jgi:hypothetical protein
MHRLHAIMPGDARPAGTIRHPASHMFFLTVALLGLGMASAPASAEPLIPDTVAPAEVRWLRQPALAGATEYRLRTMRLRSGPDGTSRLLRSPSTLLDLPTGRTALDVWVLAPSARAVYNSDLPFSLNEGSLWAGRGGSAVVSAGIVAGYRSLRLVLAPDLVYSENRAFQTFARPEEAGRDRHEFASPFHYPPLSLDQPQRPGSDPLRTVRPGQSSLTLSADRVELGVATENLWWGPGVRNSIIMSNNAPGFPHAFLRTRSPLASRLGRFEGVWLLGGLQESSHFDFDPANDHRSLSALAIVFSPRWEPNLSVGLARAVFASSPGRVPPPGAALDVFRSVGNPAAERGDTLAAVERDQLFSLFARWVFPASGFETYFEWGRYDQPESLRDFLEMPNHSQGYTLGLQWARPAFRETTFRLQAEATYLEPSSTFRVRPVGDWYASRTVSQGYTHQGRIIGASIGPSGSSQWLAGDLFGGNWSAGSYLGRIRWNNQAQFTYFPEFRYADVTAFGGVRGGYDWGPVAAALDVAYGVRYNYLFQSFATHPYLHSGVDIHNRTVNFTLSTGYSPF